MVFLSFLSIMISKMKKWCISSTILTAWRRQMMWGNRTGKLLSSSNYRTAKAFETVTQMLRQMRINIMKKGKGERSRINNTMITIICWTSRKRIRSSWTYKILRSSKTWWIICQLTMICMAHIANNTKLTTWFMKTAARTLTATTKVQLIDQKRLTTAIFRILIRNNITGWWRPRPSTTLAAINQAAINQGLRVLMVLRL